MNQGSVTVKLPFVSQTVPFVFLGLSKNITFSENSIKTGKKEIRYDDIISIDYFRQSWEQFKPKLYITLHQSDYGFAVTTETDNIYFLGTSVPIIGISNKKCDVAFEQIVNLSKKYIEPIIVEKIYQRISSDMGWVRIADFLLSKRGFCKRISEQRFICIPWAQFGGAELTFGSSGWWPVLVIYQETSSGIREIFDKVFPAQLTPLYMHNQLCNLTILPELMTYCAKEFANELAPPAEIDSRELKITWKETIPQSVIRRGKTLAIAMIVFIILILSVFFFFLFSGKIEFT
ncbi:hypothetical protein HY967_03265 [Candidatus Jorgensenbacteria bacterium]|nr:hypothetical protein [Candidatus Jorgensenbacteria bacterium]